MSQKSDLIAAAKDAVEQLATLPTPEGDHEGDYVNEYAHKFTPAQGEVFDECVETLASLVRDGAGEPDDKAIRNLRGAGFDVHFNPAQDNPMRNVGSWTLPDGRKVDLSDPDDESQD